ncbi:hypothetical protein GUJ93_ZPchr0012g21783 [Zizania palustris]|uniref:P-type ATPase A domain-containing protein n=1 Tax=Zizania palustris TaxID=103762 RepID=A0A8J5WV37_ZIZPA|nr:hypothetical protein GUJ93_ZPchr0012g21783 [Zizania palustris]
MNTGRGKNTRANSERWTRTQWRAGGFLEFRRRRGAGRTPQATAGMSALMSMAPQKAVVAETGQVVAAQDVKVNTVIAVKAGEVVPIDGVIVDGRSEVDESTLTGESFPVLKQADSQVWAGTLNIDGYIAVRTTAMADNSAVAKMSRLVEEAQNSRSNTQRIIDLCAKYYTPAVVVMAGSVAAIPAIVGAHNLKHWFQLALVLLVSACPCALVLSTPVATFCALLRAARTGLLIKGGDVLESLASIKVAAFDKTGTITRGEFSVEEFQSVGECVQLQQLLYWVSSIESRSSHPMASGLVDYAQSNSVKPKSDNVTEFKIYPGEGIYGEIDGAGIYIGNKRILSRASCETVPDMKDMKGVTIGYVACNKELIGVFTLSDACRTGSAEAIKELRSLGIKSVMLTGDSTAAATYAQNQLGNILAEVHSELLPEDKVRIVDELKAKDGPTLMVGDGMNDAPALAKADVGVSMGVSGSAVAMETSHITLMSNDICRIPKAVWLARRTHRTIIVNIIFSVITKLAIVGLAFAGHPLIWAAVLADVGTCLLLVRANQQSFPKNCLQLSMLVMITTMSITVVKSQSTCILQTSILVMITTMSITIVKSQSTCILQTRMLVMITTTSITIVKSQSTCILQTSILVMITDTVIATAKRQATIWIQTRMLAMIIAMAITTSKRQAIYNAPRKTDCHGHEYSDCEEPNTVHSTGVHACHEYKHIHCDEPISLNSAGEHACHDHEHLHCDDPIILHSFGEHACHDHDQGHEHHFCDEQQTMHTADMHSRNKHNHDNLEIEESKKDCHAELPQYHSRCCHEPHDKVKNAADSVKEYSISMGASSDHLEHQHIQEHKEEDCGYHQKVKICVPPPTDCSTRNCFSTTSIKGCGSKGKDICSSWQEDRTRLTSRCCRTYVKCSRPSSCCSHSMVKLPEIVVE